MIRHPRGCAILFGVAMLAFSHACGETRAGFSLESIEPSSSVEGIATPIMIRGERFLDAVSVSLVERNSIAFDREWSVLIGDVSGETISRLDTTALAATVPAGLPVGVYDVTVVSPAGQRVTLSEAFAVTVDGNPLRVSIESEPDGTGTPIDARSMVIGELLPVHANLREGTNWIGAASVTWSVEGSIGSLQNVSSSSVVFEAENVGMGRILASHSSAGTAATGVIRVEEMGPGPLATLRISPNTLALTADDGPVLFMVEGFDSQGRPVSELGTIAWSIGGGVISAIDPGTGSFDPTIAGEGFVIATSSLGPTAQTASVTVLPGVVATLTVAPENLGAQQNDAPTMFAVTGADTDGNVTTALGSITWSTTGTVGTIDATGLFTPDTVGMGSVRAVSSLGPADENTDVTVQAQGGGLVELASDPFGDGTRFAHVFGHNGKVLLGPGERGDQAVRMDPDGSNPEVLTFSFFGDSTGSQHRNSADPPYRSLGRPLCTRDTLECGPDNESARALFRGGRIAGNDWIIAGGGRALSGDLDYVYMSADTDSVLDFSYLDLSPFLGGQTRGLTAVHAFGNDLYLGFSDSGGSRPFLVRVQTTPTAPGLDAGDLDVVNLEARDLPNIEDSSLVMIDTIWDFNGRIYLANEHAWYRATVSRPDPADASPGDWLEITPTDPAYAAKTSTGTFLSTDLSPSNRAVPQMAVFQGRLYAARNTSDGPQLWGCDPQAAGSSNDCDAGDWFLIAPNTTGDSDLTQFNNPNNDDIGFLAATSTSLYVGFNNNTDGVVVFRAITAAPVNRGDFLGAGDCSAGAHPATCVGVGENGFGNSMVGFADGVSLDFGTTEGVYVTVGGSDLHLYRLTP